MDDCPLCKKRISDLLKHLRFVHEINDVEQFNQEKAKLVRLKTKQTEFAKYVEDLQNKMKNGEISPEEYRELITKWEAQNKI